MQIATIGVDLAKHVFQLHGVSPDGAVVLRQKLRRPQMLVRRQSRWLYVLPHSRMLPTLRAVPHQNAPDAFASRHRPGVTAIRNMAEHPALTASQRSCRQRAAVKPRSRAAGRRRRRAAPPRRRSAAQDVNQDAGRAGHHAAAASRACGANQSPPGTRPGSGLAPHGASPITLRHRNHQLVTCRHADPPHARPRPRTPARSKSDEATGQRSGAFQARQCGQRQSARQSKPLPATISRRHHASKRSRRSYAHRRLQLIQIAALHRCSRSLPSCRRVWSAWRRAGPRTTGARDQSARARGAADAGALCQSLRQARQERRSRRRSDLRGCDPADKCASWP